MAVLNRLSRRSAIACLGAAALPAGAWQRVELEPDQPLPKRFPLVAGPLEMVFEPELAFLRYLRIGEREILRGIYAALRDRNWGTVAPRVSNLVIELREDAFRLSFEAVCRQDPIDFAWRGEIAGDAEGRVRFSFDGLARSTFLRNRIGFCVLHPIEDCAGEPCVVRHSDGSIERGRFPELVAPDQPFKDMVAIAHPVSRSVEAEVEFEGDIFEMEDHRNWTDASFKTYCTPLERPFPVEVPKDARIRQSVSLRLRGEPPASVFSRGREPVLIQSIPNQRRSMPSIGLGQPAVAMEAGPGQPPANLFAHMRTDWRLFAQDWPRQVERGLSDSGTYGLPLEVAVHVSNDADAELRRLARQIEGRAARVVRWLVFHRDGKSTAPRWVALARERLATTTPAASFGGGTNAYFAELNRGRPDPAEFDFLCYSINPQVHAFDNASLAENLAAQADTVLTARGFSGGKPIVISPVTLRPRFNPNATAPEAPPEPDPRQKLRFAAAWTLGSLKYLSESGVHSITYYEINGERGVAGFPLFYPLANFGEFAGGQVIWTRSGRPLAVDSLLLERGGQSRLMLANLTPEAQVVRFVWPGPVRRLLVQSIEDQSASPEHGDRLTPRGNIFEIPLDPHAYLCLTTIA